MAKSTVIISKVPDPYKVKAINKLSGLIRDMKLAEVKLAQHLNDLHPHFKISGTNLIHYLVLGVMKSGTCRSSCINRVFPR